MARCPFGSFADVAARPSNARVAPNSGHHNWPRAVRLDGFGSPRIGILPPSDTPFGYITGQVSTEHGGGKRPLAWRPDARGLTINYAKYSDNSSDRVRWAFRNLLHNKTHIQSATRDADYYLLR